MAGRRKQTAVASDGVVPTEPVVKHVLFADVARVAGYSFKGLKGDAHAQTRRKITDARNVVGAFARLVQTPNKADAALRVIEEFEKRYGVHIQK